MISCTLSALLYIHRNPVEAGFVENEKTICIVARWTSLIKKD